MSPSEGSPDVQRPSEDAASRTRAHDFRRYVEPEIEVLLRVARTLTGSKMDAEDLVQETLIRAFRSVDRFDGRHPRAWLVTILRNTNVNMHRRQRPHPTDDWTVLDHGAPAFGARSEPDPEQVMLDATLDERLERAVRSLDRRFQTVLVLVDVHGLTYAEAAESMGVPVGTVMSRLHRARDRVRRYLNNTTLNTGSLR